jgi:hypothetical protein
MDLGRKTLMATMADTWTPRIYGPTTDRLARIKQGSRLESVVLRKREIDRFGYP